MLETKRPDIVVKTLKGDWTEAAAFNAVNSWLRLSTSKTMHVAAIGCQNDAMALGARKAVHDIASNEDRQNLIKLPFLGCDGQCGPSPSAPGCLGRDHSGASNYRASPAIAGGSDANGRSAN